MAVLPFVAGTPLTAAELNQLQLTPSFAERDPGFGTYQTTSSATFVDLATVGPAVTVTTGTAALVTICCACYTNNTAYYALMSFAISGATTLAASTARAVYHNAGPTFGVCISRTLKVTGLTAGSNTFTAKYAVQNAAAIAGFEKSQIVVVPLL